MPRITISYRRGDSAAITGRIFDRLVTRYGRDAIFRDIDDIPAGVDFRLHIDQMLAGSDIVLAIVGPLWVGPSESQNRLRDEADPVRVEIEMALRKGTPVIPVLVLGATMPTASQLPESLKDFAYRNAVRIDPEQDFDVHLSRLVRSIDRILEAAGASISAGGGKPAGATKKPLTRRRLVIGSTIAGFLAVVVAAGLYLALDRQKQALPPGSSRPPDTDLVAWWAGDSPNSRVNGLKGEFIGEVTQTRAFDGSPAFSFDGSGYLRGSAASLPIGSSPRIIEFWFVITQVPENHVDQANLLCYGSIGAWNKEYCILYSQEFGLAITNFGHGGGVSQLTIGSWHHLLASSVGPVLSIYFDGERVPTSGYFDVLDTGKTDFIYIGGIPVEIAQKLKTAGIVGTNFHGLIKDVRIYTSSLPPQDHDILYSQTKEKFPSYFK